MNEANALLLLGFSSRPSADELPDLIEEKVFEVRTYFLRQPVVPELFRSRIRKLNQLAEASAHLGLSFERHLDINLSNLAQTDLLPLLNSYSAEMSMLKLRVASTLNPKELSHLAEVMVAYQIQFEDLFFELTETHPLKEETVNAAAAMDVGELLFEMKKENTDTIQALISKERTRIAARQTRMG